MPGYIRFVLLLAVFTPLLHAQEGDGPIKMTPQFPLAFPFAQNGKDVTVKFPVMTNPTVIIKPGMILRTLYIPPLPDDDQNLVLAHKGNMENSFSRSTLSPDEQSKMPPEIAHQLERFRRTVWDTSNTFQLAMAQYPTDVMHLMYSPTGEDKDVSDSRFSFFEGLLIGLPDGKVTVLAVEDGSKSDAAGFKAGDEILAVGDVPVRGDLTAFANAYVAARHEAKDANAATFSYTVQEPGKSGTRVLTVGMPPTIKSQLMNGF